MHCCVIVYVKVVPFTQCTYPIITDHTLMILQLVVYCVYKILIGDSCDLCNITLTSKCMCVVGHLCRKLTWGKIARMLFAFLILKLWVLATSLSLNGLRVCNIVVSIPVCHRRGWGWTPSCQRVGLFYFVGGWILEFSILWNSCKTKTLDYSEIGVWIIRPLYIIAAYRHFFGIFHSCNLFNHRNKSEMLQSNIVRLCHHFTG